MFGSSIVTKRREKPQHIGNILVSQTTICTTARMRALNWKKRRSRARIFFLSRAVQEAQQVERQGQLFRLLLGGRWMEECIENQLEIMTHQRGDPETSRRRSIDRSKRAKNEDRPVSKTIMLKYGKEKTGCKGRESGSRLTVCQEASKIKKTNRM